MFVIHKPDGGEERAWEYLPGDFDLLDARRIETTYSSLCREAKTWDEFKVDVVSGSALAKLVLLWYYRSLDEASLRVEDVKAKDREVRVEHSFEELEQMRDFIASAPETAETRMLLAQVNMQFATARRGSGKADSVEDAVGALSLTSGTRSGSRPARSPASGRASRKRN